MKGDLHHTLRIPMESVAMGAGVAQQGRQNQHRYITFARKPLEGPLK